MTSSLEVIKDLFCGCMSGWGQVVSMLPFENIKIKMISKPQEYNQGIIHAFKKTLSEEGFLALYKGMLFPLIGVGAQVSVQFGIVQSLKKILKAKYGDAQGNLAPIYTFYSGLACGIPSAIIVTPLDHSRFKVTLVKQKGIGSVGMAAQITKQYGIATLFRGFIPTLYREAAGLGCYFGAYDYFIRYFTNQGKVNLLGSLVCGALAGIAFWTPVYPVDYVKTILQGDSLEKPNFSGSIDCFRKQFAKGGAGIFFTGYGIMMARAVVCNAVGFLSFELGKRMVYE